MISRLLAGLALVPILIVGGPAASAPCLDAMAPRFQTFNIEMEVEKDTYRIGEKAVFHFVITRPADKDPLEQNIPINSPFRHPAEGVSITLSLWAKNALPKAAIGGPTDAEGKATMEMVLDKRFKTGVTYADVYAWIKYPKVSCLDPEEWGKRVYENPFEVEH